MTESKVREYPDASARFGINEALQEGWRVVSMTAVDRHVLVVYERPGPRPPIPPSDDRN
jgi:hypothetical protein